MAPTTGPSEGGAPPPGQRPQRFGPPPPPAGGTGAGWPATSGATAVGWAPPPELPPYTPERVPRTRPPREPDPSPARLLAIALVAGVAIDLGIRGGFVNVAVALGLAAVVVGLVTDRRLRQRSARVVALLALIPIGFLAVRASAWLAVTNLLAAGALAAAAIAYSRSGSPFDATLGRLVRRLVGAVPAACTAPLTLRPLLPRVSSERTARLTRIAVAVAVCLPVLLVVAALLAAADPVFAGLLTPDLGFGPTIGHVVLISFFAAGAVCAIGSAASDTPDRERTGQFGVVETVTMLALTAAVLGLFVLAQLVALTSAGERLVEDAGLTPAEYARSGFFQLCWAAGIILTLLAVVRALASPDALRAASVRALGALAPTLALGLVAVSLRRMALYDDAFGLTMLRLWVLGATVWMGVVLILVAARNAGVAARREWVVPAAAAVALALVVAADVVDPEAFVTRHNLTRAGQGAELDPAYLATLSDDATPAIAAAYAAGTPAEQDALAPALRCDADRPGVIALNVAVQRATDARRAACEALDGG